MQLKEKEGYVTEKEGYELCVYAIALKNQIEHMFLQLGAALKEIKENNHYEPQWSSFHEYVEMELNMSPSKASKLQSVYETFSGVDEEKLVKAGGWSNLYEIQEVVDNEDDAEEWIEKAGTLTRKDLRTEIRKRKTGIEPAECDHDDSYIIRVCRKCKQRIQIHEEEV